MLILSDDSTIVSGSLDKNIILWNLETSKQEFILEGRNNDITSLTLSHGDQYVVAGSTNGVVIVFDVKKRSVERIEMKGYCIRYAALTNDLKNMIVYNWAGSLEIWEWCGESSRPLREIAANCNRRSIEPSCIVLDRRGESFFVSSDDSLRACGVHTEEERVFDGHTGSASCLCLSEDGRYAVSGASDRTVRVWDLRSREQIAVLGGHTRGVTALAVTRDFRYAVSGASDKCVRVWNLETREVKNVFEKGFANSISSLRITCSNKYVVCCCYCCFVQVIRL